MASSTWTVAFSIIIALGLATIAPAAAAQEAVAVYFVLLIKPSCDELEPGFRKATAVTYAAWEKNNAALIAEVRKDPQFQQQSRAAIEHPRPKPTGNDAQELKQSCDELVELFASALPAPADPKLATPERAWQTFREALIAGDRKTLKTCFAGSLATRLLPDLEAMTNGPLKTMGESFVGMQLTAKYEPYQEAAVVRNDGRAGIVTFVKVGADWKIYEM